MDASPGENTPPRGAPSDTARLHHRPDELLANRTMSLQRDLLCMNQSRDPGDFVRLSVDGGSVLLFEEIQQSSVLLQRSSQGVDDLIVRTFNRENSCPPKVRKGSEGAVVGSDQDVHSRS